MKKIIAALIVLKVFPLLAQPVITGQPADQSVVWGGNAMFNVTVSGTGPFTYQWRMNGTNLPNNLISTVAGGQFFDGLPATNTVLNSPQGTAVDTAGNIYIADSFNHVIRKVSTNGVSQIVAGNGSAGFFGDGGPATNAMLFAPAGVILDAARNLLIADSYNNRVRKVDTNGIISTFAGNGSTPLTPTSEGNGGPATNGMLNLPTALAVNGVGDVYIADSGDNQIRKVDTSGLIGTFVNSSGTYGFNGDNLPAANATLAGAQGVTVDAVGNLYIADTFNYRVRKYAVATGRITTIAGNGIAGFTGDGGSATAASINYCYAVQISTNGTIYFTDSGNHRLRKITNGIISTIAGTGVSGFSGDGGVGTNASLNLPGGLSLDVSNNVFIADEGNNRIRKISSNGNIFTVAGRNLMDGMVATNGTLNFAYGTARDIFGNIYIADTANGRIRKMDTNGIIFTVAGSDAIGFSGDGATATNAKLNHVYGVAVDRSANIFIADASNLRIRKVDANGIISTYAGNGTFSYSSASNGGAATNTGIRPYGIAADNFGNVFIADINNVIRKVNTNGIINLVAGTGSFGHSGDGGAATNALVVSPMAIFANGVGEIFFSESGAIRKVNTNGIISTVAGKGYTLSGFSGDGGTATNAKISGSIWGIWNDAAGNLFFADGGNHIRKVDTNGIITSVAGIGALGFSGDGGSASAASMSLPRGIVGDDAGNLFFVDSGNNRLRKISNLEFADQPAFTLTGVDLNSASNSFSVVITSASGSVTSSVANIHLQLPPLTAAYSAVNSAVNLSWAAMSNLNYQVQFTTNLLIPNWQNLGSVVLAVSNSIFATDIPADAQRFYRVQLVP